MVLIPVNKRIDSANKIHVYWRDKLNVSRVCCLYHSTDNIRTLSANLKFICTSFRNRKKCEPGEPGAYELHWVFFGGGGKSTRKSPYDNHVINEFLSYVPCYFKRN